MKYLKKFEQLSDFESFIGGGVDRPNVSYIAEDGACFYLPSLTHNIIIYKTSDNSTWLYSNELGGVLDDSGNACLLLANTNENGEGKLEFNSDIKILELSALFDSETGKVTSITLPDGIEELHQGAFYSIPSLTSVAIPKSIKVIQGGAFLLCPLVSDIQIDSANSFYYINGNCIIAKENNVLIFAPNSFTMPNDVKAIGDYAFYGNSLTFISLPDTVASIGDSSFYKCTSLTAITIPNSVTTIGKEAFYQCNLKSLTINPINPPVLGTGAFNDGNNNMVIYVPSESVEAYKIAEGWKDYASKIQAIA